MAIFWVMRVVPSRLLVTATSLQC